MFVFEPVCVHTYTQPFVSAANIEFAVMGHLLLVILSDKDMKSFFLDE